MNYYKLNICGFKRQLPIVKIGPKYAIASFSLLGDVDLVEVISEKLLQKIKDLEFDYLVGTEIKVLPLVYQMSHILNHKNYIIAHKKILGFMVSPIKTEGKNPLVLNGADADILENKKVVLVNDVVSTGKTTQEMEQLISKAKAKVSAVVSVLKQGELQYNIEKPFFYLQTLPLFKFK